MPIETKHTWLTMCIDFDKQRLHHFVQLNKHRVGWICTNLTSCSFWIVLFRADRRSRRQTAQDQKGRTQLLYSPRSIHDKVFPKQHSPYYVHHAVSTTKCSLNGIHHTMYTTQYPRQNVHEIVFTILYTSCNILNIMFTTRYSPLRMHHAISPT
jgi:hypothetical protein